MPRYQPKEISYPLSSTEYHIVTEAGVSAYITNNYELARAKLKNSDPSFRLVEVETVKRDITPRKSKSGTVKQIARQLHLVCDDMPLAMCS